MIIGFVFHLSVNDHGVSLAFCLTAGNTDDRNPKVMAHLTKELFGKLFADKGYVSQNLSDALWNEGIQLVTKQKRKAKKKGLFVLSDKILLRKRAVIEKENLAIWGFC